MKRLQEQQAKDQAEQRRRYMEKQKAVEADMAKQMRL
jgi:hypothetical protein